MKLNQVTVGCIDYAASVAFYKLIGLRQIVDSPPNYARFETPSGETFSIHCENHPSQSATVVYFEVDDVDAKCAELKRLGLKLASEPTDESWLWREARLIDPSGNQICIYFAGENRRFPPWRIQE